ncbi:hypothetical protein AB5J72_05475 [Streptomyces sp. CG1]|uniref:hypothetical protein n=1 Tax=Streptomyces sp. CG1 TaxID=1287523 RepID=UPI0034E26E23
MEQARFLARDVGDLRRAAHALQRLRTVDTGGEHAVEAALLWHVLAGLGHEVPDAGVLDVPLRSRKDLLDGGVAAVLADPARAAELAEALAEVRSPGHRLTVLAGLSLCATPERPVPELDLLRPAFAVLIEDEAGDLDHQVRLALLAEFERVRGRPEAAARLVAGACSALDDTAGDDPSPKWMWAQAQIRCGGAPEREPGWSLYHRAADELAWAVYDPVRRSAAAHLTLREPPLTFLDRHPVPFAAARGSAFEELLSSGAQRTLAGRRATAHLPFPVDRHPLVGEPSSALAARRHPWDGPPHRGRLRSHRRARHPAAGARGTARRAAGTVAGLGG